MGCSSEKSVPINIIEKNQDLGNSELDIDLHDIEKQGEGKHPKIEEKNDEKINENKQKENNTNNDAEYCNEINIVYKIDNQDGIRIFGDEFVRNNKSKCKIEFENKEYDLIEWFNIENYTKNKLDYLRIKLKYINNVTNMGYMFSGCSSLSSLPDISKWNTNNVTNMSYMFYNCSSLSSLPDISKWNTKTINDIYSMFCNCSSLSYLPDISKWNTSNVEDVNHMLDNCSLILLLPKISKENGKFIIS